MVDQGTGLYSQKNIRTSVFFPGRFKLSQSSPTVRNATYLRTFFFNLFMSFERFCQPACFFAARFTLRQPKTPVRNATNLRSFCFEDYHYAFQETLCPVTLAHWIFVFYSSLYFYTYDTFRPIVVPFRHFTSHQFFLICITTRNTFLIPDDTVARNLIITFNFTSQRRTYFSI